MKVLSIGNAYSSDSQIFLPHLAKAAGKELLLAALNCEDASVEDHYNNYVSENDSYYYETYLEGETEKIKAEEICLHEAVEDDDWDIITIQQNDVLSGIRESYSPWFAEIAAYCKLMHPDCKIMVFQPWAYEQGCPKREFAENYGNDQKEMYNMINQCCHEVSDEAEADAIIPVGRAWQIVRDTNIGDRMTRDGSNANELGQFLSSCVLYQAIFGENAASSPFELPGYDKAISTLLKACADAAF